MAVPVINLSYYVRNLNRKENLKSHNLTFKLFYADLISFYVLCIILTGNTRFYILLLGDGRYWLLLLVNWAALRLISLNGCGVILVINLFQIESNSARVLIGYKPIKYLFYYVCKYNSLGPKVTI